MHLPRKGGAFFMLKVKIVDGVTKHKLEDELNEFLSTLTSEEVRNIVYDFPSFTPAIEWVFVMNAVAEKDSIAKPVNGSRM